MFCRSSVICIGDRLICVNGRSIEGVGVSEVTQMINNSRPSVTLELEFEVADSVIPSSGTFAVKLAKRHSGLGIIITSKFVSFIQRIRLLCKAFFYYIGVQAFSLKIL